MVGLLTSVQSEMGLEVALLVESFATVLEGTDEVPLTLVFLQVHL